MPIRPYSFYYSLLLLDLSTTLLKQDNLSLGKSSKWYSHITYIIVIHLMLKPKLFSKIQISWLSVESISKVSYILLKNTYHIFKILFLVGHQQLYLTLIVHLAGKYRDFAQYFSIYLLCSRYHLMSLWSIISMCRRRKYIQQKSDEKLRPGLKGQNCTNDNFTFLVLNGNVFMR